MYLSMLGIASVSPTTWKVYAALPGNSQRQEAPMKRTATVALMLLLGVPAVHAQQNPVKMTYSGSNVATTINLQNGTVTDEELLAGNGALGTC
jgi:hypothetical protein